MYCLDSNCKYHLPGLDHRHFNFPVAALKSPFVVASRLRKGLEVGYVVLTTKFCCHGTSFQCSRLREPIIHTRAAQLATLNIFSVVCYIGPLEDCFSGRKQRQHLWRQTEDLGQWRSRSLVSLMQTFLVQLRQSSEYTIRH
jgi:hypothetical protein